MAVIAASSLWFLWHNRQQPTPVDPNDGPWIGLPKSGMDAALWGTRALLQRALELDPRNQPFAISCGIEGDETPYRGKEKDRYIAHIGASAFDPSWKIVMDVDKGNINIKWGLGDTVPPPPLPMDDHRQPATMVMPVSMTQKSRIQMERIRELWNNQALWHEPQDANAFGCLDGDPVFLEACVNGQYAARFRNCNTPAMEATDELWKAFNGILAPPARPEWRDATGNPVPGPSIH